ncbi:MAG: peptidoglycan DD-metalloendopeptidase family protein [Clostridia bacterium]|nr:peptidoglycan DD-metalloendopeptidase family protein [Clostridia bacterium]
MQKNKWKILLFLFVMFATPHFVSAETLEELQKELSKIKDQQMAVKDQYSTIETDMAIYQEKKQQLEEKITTYNKKIESLGGKIEATAKEVQELEQQLQEAALNYESTKDLLYTRLRALYENDFVNMWEVLFTSSSILEFLSKYSVMIELIEYDTTRLKAMQNQKEYISNLKQTAEMQKIQVDQVKYDLETTRASLEILKENQEANIRQLEATKVNLDAKQKELENLSKEIEEKYIKLREQLNYSGDLIWPLRSYGYITSYMGVWRPELGQFYGHSGLDIVSTGDKPYNKYYAGGYVRAASAGKVVGLFKETPRDKGNKNSRCPDTAQGANYTCGGVSSYGRYVMIYSASTGYTIVYGHMYEIFDGIELGSYVEQGQLIGVMGTTGSSTGVHLHFEVRKPPGYYANAMDPLLIQSLVDSRNLLY